MFRDPAKFVPDDHDIHVLVKDYSKTEENKNIDVLDDYSVIIPSFVTSGLSNPEKSRLRRENDNVIIGSDHPPTPTSYRYHRVIIDSDHPPTPNNNVINGRSLSNLPL